MPTNWEMLQERIRSKISKLNYSKWFSFLKPSKEDDNQLTIAVPDKFFYDWIMEYYIDMLKTEYSDIIGKEAKIHLEIDESLQKEIEDKIDSLPLPQPTKQEAPKTVTTLSGLNPKYIFETFVVGSANQFAHAAAKAVADLPGGHYNPMFIYGGVGLGKTHLLSAIGLEILKKHPQLKVIYTTAEGFMNEVIFGIRFDKMVDLRKKYRQNCDVLLIDDIQFLGGKERTQDEFFHTFNVLTESQRQIVVTSDRFPKDIPDIEDRLRSRFEWGLIADIQPPDLETRIAILRKKAQLSKIDLPDDVAMYLATRIRANIREMEGALIRLSAYAGLTKAQLNIPFAEKMLGYLSNDSGSICSIDSIQKMVSDHYKIKIQDLKSARRTKTLVIPRQIAMYLCKKHVGASFPEIGTKFGGKDHTTVIHAIKKIDAILQSNSQLKEEIEQFEKKLTVN